MGYECCKKCKKTVDRSFENSCQICDNFYCEKTCKISHVCEQMGVYKRIEEEFKRNSANIFNKYIKDIKDANFYLIKKNQEMGIIITELQKFKDDIEKVLKK